MWKVKLGLLCVEPYLELRQMSGCLQEDGFDSIYRKHFCGELIVRMTIFSGIILN